MIISLDTECTGLDLAHGAMPFLVTTCRLNVSPEEAIKFWEWPVDPLTRRPDIPADDIMDIAEYLDAADLIYLQNSKYDARALATIDIQLPWPKVRDTLVMGHLLASNHRHDLTWMCIEYLGIDIEKHELLIKEVTQACRAIVKRDFPHWRIAEEGDADMPSVKGSSKRDEDKPWKNDMWLPAALAKQLRSTRGPSLKFRLSDQSKVNLNWVDACSRYANADSEHTIYLGLEMERLILERGYWKIYEHRLELPCIASEMESYGVTAIGEYTGASINEYGEHVAEAEAELVSIAAEYGHKLELADGASINDNMRDFFYGGVSQECEYCSYFKRIKHWNGDAAVEGTICPKCSTRKRNPLQPALVTVSNKNLGLPVIMSKKTGNATLDGDAMKDYITTLDDGPALDFIEMLSDKRMYDTALTYMHSYRRFWVPVEGIPGYYRIHASFNPFGTDHLRWASNSPNMQNVSGETKEISNRACFGPAPGREWWSMDYRSIERRIPAYESGEPKMIEVFEKPNEGPYWGSLYLLTASVLYQKEFWAATGEGKFREAYPRLYKQAKFFDLAKQYGCGRRKGDTLSRIKNSFDLVDNEFPLLAKLQAKVLAQAERLGYVETIPDKTVDPTRGYPVLVSRTEDGRVLSTTPFNYKTSGTACWAKNKALVRCSKRLDEWCEDGFDARISIEVHDEILFDFPRGATMDENLPLAIELKELMELSGDDIGIPCPVAIKFHTKSWAEGIPT